MYCIAEPNDLPNLVQELFSRSTNNVPVSVASDIKDVYHLREVEQLFLLPQDSPPDSLMLNAGGTVEWITARSFTAQLKSVSVETALMESGLVSFQYGRASGFATFTCNGALIQTALAAVIYDGLVASRDHCKLLSLFAMGLQCSLYDSDWGNRIHLDDPYYQYRPRGGRPAEPLNAHS